MTLLADSAEFASLRPDVRDAVRQAERQFRHAIEEMLEQLPAHMRPTMAEAMSEMPTYFFSGQLALYRMMSEALDVGEMLQLQLERQAPLSKQVQ
jgi:hypothetical protein